LRSFGTTGLLPPTWYGVLFFQKPGNVKQEKMKNTSLYLLILVTVCWTACDDNDDNSSNNKLQSTDQTFVQNVALGNLTEVDFASLATSKASDSAVMAFANHMIAEHNQAQNDLRDIGNDYNNVTWPSGMDAKHQQIRQQLDSLEGFAFDSVYIKSQVEDHQMVLNLFQHELDSGANQRVKDYANKYLPHIQDHLQMADSIQTILQNNRDRDSQNSRH
jgi:putative membrane protein